MCSLEEAWGTTFDNKPVESQADDRKQHSNVPDNLMYPNMDYGPSQKVVPGKHRFTRGVHSKLTRKPRMTKQNLHNGAMNLHVDQYDVQQNNRPKYLDLYPKPADLIPNSDTYPMPVETVIPEEVESEDNNLEYMQNIPKPLTTKQHGNAVVNFKGDLNDEESDQDYYNFNEAFQVSNTVDNFMNMGLNMYSNVNQNNTNSNFEKIKNNNPNNFKRMDKSLYDMDLNNNNTNSNNTKKDNDYDEEEFYKISNNTNSLSNDEVLKLLNVILGKLEKVETKINKNTFNIHDKLLLILVTSLLSVFLYCMISKSICSK
tara:strand:- start:1617 stop:2561 length:945 start_codon:yes stop_codon:yes gene_type:complete